MRWLRWTIGVVVGLVVLAVAATTIYVHTVSAPALLTLPKDADQGSGAASSAVTVDGIWNVGPGSIVGWRAQQVLIGQLSPIVGRTGTVWGSLTISGGSVTQGSFSVDMGALTSSTSKTTQQRAFDVSAYPTAVLALTSPIELGTIPAEGTIERFPAASTITMHGVTHTVQFTVSAERIGDGIYVLADITFPYGEWDISAQGVPFLADLQSPATIEVLLHLTQGTGNPPSVAARGAAHGGGPS